MHQGAETYNLDETLLSRCCCYFCSHCRRVRPRTASFFFFFFNDPAPPEIYPLPLPDALPISAARPAELGDERQVEDGERHEDAVLDGERHGRDREGASRVALGRPDVRHPARSTRRWHSDESIDCRRWGGSIGFVTWSKAPNARLRLASSMFTLSFSMITFAAGTSATIAGSTPTPLSPGISTSSNTRWGAFSTTARTPLAASLMRRTS